MKKIYLLFLLIAIFGFNQMNAQTTCPDGSFVVGTPPDQQIILTFDPGPGPDCSTRPLGILVDGASSYAKGVCDTNYVVYNWIFGPGVADPNSYTVSYDGSSCLYTGNLLPIGEFEFLNATLRVYPNPMIKSNQLNLKFATNTSAKISMYDVTGKLALTDEIENSRRKEINTSSLNSGIYFLRLQTDNIAITKKVIIQK